MLGSARQAVQKMKALFRTVKKTPQNDELKRLMLELTAERDQLKMENRRMRHETRLVSAERDNLLFRVRVAHEFSSSYVSLSAVRYIRYVQQ